MQNPKTLLTKDGDIAIRYPRDILSNSQQRLTGGARLSATCPEAYDTKSNKNSTLFLWTISKFKNYTQWYILWWGSMATPAGTPDFGAVVLPVPIPLLYLGSL